MDEPVSSQTPPDPSFCAMPWVSGILGRALGTSYWPFVGPIGPFVDPSVGTIYGVVPRASILARASLTFLSTLHQSSECLLAQ